MRYYLCIPFILFTLACVRLNAQANREINTLHTLIKKDKEDTNLVIHLNKLCKEYRTISRYDSAHYYAKEALLLAKKLNYNNGTAIAYNNIGTIYHNQDKFEKALENYYASLKVREETGDKKGIASSYNNIGIIYRKQNNYAKALENYFISLKIKKEIGDKQGIAASYNNIGLIYSDQLNYDKALENYLASLTISKELALGDRTAGNMAKYREVRDGMAVLYNNIGLIYGHKNNFDKALENYFASLEIRKDAADKKEIAICYINIGNAYTKKNKFSEANLYLQRGLNLALEIGSYQRITDAYLGYAELGEKMKDFPAAYKYHRLYSQFKDSVLNEVSLKEIAGLQTKFETEKKEKEIEIQNLKISEQGLLLNRSRTFLFLFIIFALLIIAVSTIGFSRYKIKKQAEAKSEMLRVQELHTNAIIETQEEERKRIAQDLHDGIGHKLAAVKINFEKLAENMEWANAEKKNIFDRTTKVLDETHKEVRTLSHQMMPKALKEKELMEAIADLMEETLANSKIKYRLETDKNQALEGTVQVGIYRVLQELLTNILKHAGATEVSVQIFTAGKHVIMMVEDNGWGITNKKNNGNGIGLNNIAGRVNALKGIFTIEPGPIKGTVATIRIPV